MKLSLKNSANLKEVHIYYCIAFYVILAPSEKTILFIAMQSEVLAKKVSLVEIILPTTFVQLSPKLKYTITINIIQ